MDIGDKVVVITGASDGIGREIALRLARESTKLALIARDEDKLQIVQKEALQLSALDVKIYSCDITDTENLKLVIEQILFDYSVVDVLINNAGIWQKLSQLDDISQDIVDLVIATNLTALIHMTRLLLPALRLSPDAAIINISSKSGITAQAGQSIYTATKYGVRGFTDVLKNDLKDTNIRVAGVYQSGTNTGMFGKTGEDFPVETFSDPSDLADVIAYMLKMPPKIWLHDVRVDK